MTTAIHDLEICSQEAIKNCEGAKIVIEEIDEYGHIWLEKVTLQTEDSYESDKFALEPYNFEKSDYLGSHTSLKNTVKSFAGTIAGTWYIISLIKPL